MCLSRKRANLLVFAFVLRRTGAVSVAISIPAMFVNVSVAWLLFAQGYSYCVHSLYSHVTYYSYLQQYGMRRIS